MVNVSANFHTLSIQDAPTTRVRIYFIGPTVDCTDYNDVTTNGTLLTWAAGDTNSNRRIGQDGIKFTEYYNPEYNVEIGRAVSSQIEMTLLNTDGGLNNFAYGRCKVFLEVLDAANSIWLSCPMGVYNIELPTKRKAQLIHAFGYDQMQLLDDICDSWWSGLNWSGGLTMLQIVQSMGAQLGFSISSATATAIVNSGITYTAAPFDCVETTYREILELIAEATGTVARFDRNGALDLKRFREAQISGSTVQVDTDTVGNQCLAIDLAEYQVAAIDKLKVKIAEDDQGVVVGSGTNQYTILENLFLDGTVPQITTRATNIYNRLNSLGAYKPIQTSLIWDWSIEAGDIIEIVRDSTTYTVPIFQQTMTWRGGYVVSEVVNSGDAVRPVPDYNERSTYRMQSEMSAKVGDNEIISKINQSPEAITIQANKISLLGYTTINNGFKVNLDGTFEANGATINGAFTSSDTVAGVPFSMQMVGSTFSIMNNANPMFRVQPKADGSFSGRVDMADNNSNQITVDGAGVSVASQINGGVAQTIALSVQGTDPNNRGVLNLFGVKNNRNVSIRLDPTGGSTFGNSFSDSDVTVYGNVSATGNSSVGGDLSVTGTINSIGIEQFNITAGSSRTVTLANSTAHYFIVSGSTSNHRTTIIAYSTNAGAVSYTMTPSASSITVTTGTNYITIAVSGYFVKVMHFTF